MFILQILLILVLLALGVQDFKYRQVYWFWFPFLTGLTIITGLANRTIGNIISASALNISFVAIQLLLVTVYFSVKSKHPVNITNGLLGWGDILLLISIAFYFPTLNFIAFYAVSLILILIAGLYFLSREKKETQIPMAGLQCVIFIVCLIIDKLGRHNYMISDTWLTRYLNP